MFLMNEIILNVILCYTNFRRLIESIVVLLLFAAVEEEKFNRTAIT